MAVSTSLRDGRRAHRSSIGEAVVLASMATVSAVLAAALVVQLGTPLWAACTVAALFFAAVLAAHVLVRRSEQLSELRREMAGMEERMGRIAFASPSVEANTGPRLAAPTLRPTTQAVEQLGGPFGQLRPADARSGTHREAAPQLQHIAGTFAQHAATKEALRAERPQVVSPSADSVRIAATHGASEFSAVPSPAVAPAGLSPANTSAEIGRALQEMTRATSGGSLDLPAPTVAGASVPDYVERALAAPARLADPVANRSTAGDHGAVASEREPEPAIEALLAETAPRPPIDDLLRRLAGDISAGGALRDISANDALRDVRAVAAADPQSIAAGIDRSAAEAAAAGALEAGLDLPGGAPWSLPENPVGSHAMERQSEITHENATLADAVGGEGIELVAVAQGKVAAIVDALSNERIDLFLEPIIGFESLAPEHYEVTARLRLADGETLDQAACADAARGTGLLALIDTVKIARSKRLLTRTMVDGSERVLNALDAETLSSEQFHEDIADLAASSAGLAGRLVLTFRQRDVRAFAPVEWQALARLAAIGFRFGVDAVGDLDMDFTELADGGFVFARLDADVFLDGMMVAGGERVSPADVCRHLTSSGLGLVVGRIDDPKRLARVMGFGVMMGQGAMFGAPRSEADFSSRARGHDA